MTTTLLTNANVIDTRAGTTLADRHVLIRDGVIVEVSETPPRATADRELDVAGQFLLPGLCDGHVHVTAITPDFPLLKRLSPFYVAARSSDILQAMLMRGFTTVRDAGGADHGLARAVDEDHIVGPRVLFCGHALSQTGGHGDMRGPGEQDLDQCLCCAGLGVVCDGVPEVRRAARDEIRKGATHLKIMASGGVSSPTDRIDSDQFALDEIEAIVAEANAANIHVMAHAYTARSINRLIPRGVRTIEHGNMLDDESCRLFHEHGAYLTPTLATYNALAREGVEAGMAPDLQRKVYSVLDAGAAALERAYRSGVRMVFGTDLLGRMHTHQLTEFDIRAEVVPADELLRSATCTAAEAFLRDGEFGVVEPGARADLLVAATNPLDDIASLTRPEENLRVIMKAGHIYKNTL